MVRLNKRGQELSIGTLVLIVLGIIVLVLLVLGFSIGWDNLFRKIGIFQGNDIASVVTACNVAVSSQSQASYCEFKKINVDGETEYVNCEDGRVGGQIQSKLNSCDKEGEDIAEVKYCNELKKRDPKVDTSVNQFPCKVSGP